MDRTEIFKPSVFELPKTPESKREKLRFACDIDDVLADTWESLVRFLNEYWKTNFSSGEIARYGYVQDFPVWKAFPGFYEAMENLRADPKFNLGLKPLEGAVEGLNRLAEVASLTFYLTARPVAIQKETEAWLRHYRFPDAPAISRPMEVSFEQGGWWKERILRESGVTFMIEDGIQLAQRMPELSFIVLKRPFSLNIERGEGNILLVKDWTGVVEEVEAFV